MLNFCWASIFLKLIPQYLVNCCADPIKHTTFWKSMMRSFRRWSQICKKCTILGNLRTITHEKKRKLDKWPHFSSTFWVLTVWEIHFCIWKCQNSFSWSSPFVPFRSEKYRNFGGISCEIRILTRLTQETHIKESKKPGFSIELRTKFVWSHGLYKGQPGWSDVLFLSF